MCTCDPINLSRVVSSTEFASKKMLQGTLTSEPKTLPFVPTPKVVLMGQDARMLRFAPYFRQVQICRYADQ